jgi:hypothetical protein
VGGRTRSGSAAAARDGADAAERIASDQPEARRIPAHQAEALQNELTPEAVSDAATTTPAADQRRETTQAAILPPAQTAAAQAVNEAELRTGLRAMSQAHAAALQAMGEAHAAALHAMREAHAAELRAAMTLASAPASQPDHRRRERALAVDETRFPVVAGAPDVQAERAMRGTIGAMLDRGREAVRAAVGFCTGRAGVRGEPARRGER